jgi:hypothetical protein
MDVEVRITFHSSQALQFCRTTDGRVLITWKYTWDYTCELSNVLDSKHGKQLLFVPNKNMDRDSSVGIATRNGPDGPGIESRGGEIFRTRPDRL